MVIEIKMITAKMIIMITTIMILKIKLITIMIIKLIIILMAIKTNSLKIKILVNKHYRESCRLSSVDKAVEISFTTLFVTKSCTSVPCFHKV